MSQAIRVRNLREGEAASLPAALLDHGMAYLVPEWVWVVEPAGDEKPFALVVCSFAHGWLVLWRVLAISPLPPGIPLTWFMEALPQVFAAAASRGCVWFLTLLADSPVEAKLARIVQSVAGGSLVPFQGSLAVGQVARGAAAAGEKSVAMPLQSAHFVPDYSDVQQLIHAFAAEGSSLPCHQ